MSDLVERVARALAKEDGIQICDDATYALSSYRGPALAAIAAMQTDAAPALKPAVEVWTQALSTFHLGRFGHDDEAAAAVIEDDRAAIIAAKDAQIAALQAHTDALTAVLRHRGGPLCPARYYGDEQCTCGVSDALRAYEEFRRE